MSDADYARGYRRGYNDATGQDGMCDAHPGKPWIKLLARPAGPMIRACKVCVEFYEAERPN